MRWDEIAGEGDAYHFLEQIDWNGQPVCPHCDSRCVYYLTSQRTGPPDTHRWQIRTPRVEMLRLSPPVLRDHRNRVARHTAFDPHLAPRLADLCADGVRVTAAQVAIRYDLSLATARMMTRRARAACDGSPADPEDVLRRLLTVNPD